MATTALLTTKLQAPHVHSGLVWRLHLTERLSQGLSRQLTLISAPAGFGKTTLLGQWIEQTGRRVAWVSLDEGDDEPTRLWLYVISALQTLETGLGADALVMLQAGPAGRVPLESIITSIVNDIHSTSARDRIVLVLDDFHLVRTPATQATLGFFINHQPEQMHLIISSRSDPMLPLARLRARNQLAELRAADLRFAPDETAKFFNEVRGLGLSTDQISTLGNSSEGWIAGLQLAAISMQGRGDVTGFINTFAGNNRYVIDYLVEEVLRQQPEATQSFLLRTSILERLTASLCDALTLRNDGQAMLENLEKANLFITALDDQRRWYRYHHLFAEFLRHHARQLRAEELPLLRQRASQWHERHGLVAEAIDYALAARDFDRAAALIESVSRATVMAGDVARLMGWLDALPDEVVRTRPVLSLAAAWAFVILGDANAAEERLKEVEKGLADDDAGYVLGSIAAIRANLACMRRDAPLALELSHRALELLPPESLVERGLVLQEMGNVYTIEDDFAGAGRTLAQAIAIDEATGNRIGAVLGLNSLVSVQIMQGRLREAAATFSHAMQVAAAPSGSALPYASIACLSMAAIAYEWDDLAAAERHAREGLDFSQRWGRPACAALARIHLARLATARGDWKTAGEELEAADRLLSEHDFPDVEALQSACRLRLLTRWGNEAAAVRWIRRRRLRLEDEPGYDREAEYVALALSTLAAAMRKPDTVSLRAAAALLERMGRRAEAGGRMGNLLEILAIRSLILYALGDTTKAIPLLDHALALAEPEGYIRSFVDLGPTMAPLLRNAASRGVAPGYADALLAAFEREMGLPHAADAGAMEAHPPHVLAPPFVESLSEREVEVLRLVAEGLSNREIAWRLFLAVGTVKRHLNNIFGKLGATSRIQAISRARERGFL